MKKPYLSLITLLLTVVSFFGHCQIMPIAMEDIQAVKKRDLIVMIEEPREKMLKRLQSKPKLGSVDDYKTDLAQYNENIKQVAEKFWPYKKTNIQFKTYSQIKELSKTKTKDFVVVVCLSAEANNYSRGYKFYDGLYWVKDIKEDFEDRNDWMFSSMVVSLIEEFEKKSIFYSPLYDVFPTKASLAAGFMSIDPFFAGRIDSAEKNGGKSKGGIRGAMEASQNSQSMMAEIAKRTPKLTEKTLIIRKEWLDKDLTEETFKKIYPYKFQICDKAFMDNIVMNQDPSYAYGVLLPYVASTGTSNIVTNFHYVIDASDNQPLAIVSPFSSMTVGMSMKSPSAPSNFTTKIIGDLVDQIKK
jgi:hypothetical protein